MRDHSQLLDSLVKRVVQNLEAWEASSPDRDQVFVASAGGDAHRGTTKTIHQIVEDVRQRTPEGEELLNSLLENMMSQAVETQIGGPSPRFDAAAFEAQLKATR